MITFIFFHMFKSKGNQITCGNKCTVDADCEDGQRCRPFKDTCYMTCEDVPQGTRRLQYF